MKKVVMYTGNPCPYCVYARALLDIASEIEDEMIVVKLNDAVSPVLIQDNSDKYSYYVIMPMKI